MPIKNAKNVQTDNNPKVQTTESPINELTDFGKYADYPFDQLMPDFFVPAADYPVPKVVKDS